MKIKTLKISNIKIILENFLFFVDIIIVYFGEFL